MYLKVRFLKMPYTEAVCLACNDVMSSFSFRFILFVRFLSRLKRVPFFFHVFCFVQWEVWRIHCMACSHKIPNTELHSHCSPLSRFLEVMCVQHDLTASLTSSSILYITHMSVYLWKCWMESPEWYSITALMWIIELSSGSSQLF